MSISVFYGARILGIIGDWCLTNYQIQYFLYISNVIFIGRYKKPLFDEPFYAWKHGPVCAKLYQELAQYGTYVVKEDIFINIKVPDSLLQGQEYVVISQVYSNCCRKRCKDLVCIKGGAWYIIRNSDRSNHLITNQDMKEEYVKLCS